MMLMSGELRTVLHSLQPNERLATCANRLGLLRGSYPRRVESVGTHTVKMSGPVPSRWNDHDTMCSHCWKLLVKACFREYGHRCAVCGVSVGVTAHHIVPRDERGANEPWNLIPLCPKCHDWVECHESRPRTREAILALALQRVAI